MNDHQPNLTDGITEYVVDAQRRGAPTVRVTAHGPLPIRPGSWPHWKVTTGKLFRKIHLETTDLAEALHVARQLAQVPTPAPDPTPAPNPAPAAPPQRIRPPRSGNTETFEVYSQQPRGWWR